VLFFDGGRTRARTLDPLIKSKRSYRDTQRKRLRGPDYST
jgi:hypothetical protein